MVLRYRSISVAGISGDLNNSVTPDTLTILLVGSFYPKIVND